MIYKISPCKLYTFLQMAIRYADKMNCDLPQAQELCKKLLQTSWDENAELEIKIREA